MTSLPRIMISATGSNCGKTTIAIGVLRALLRRGLHPLACKTGPDYIDPLFHRAVLGVPSENLDRFFADDAYLKGQLRDAAQVGSCDMAVIEGAMGFYDGIAQTSEASAWDVARATETPVVLAVDAKGRARSLSAEVSGFARFIDDGRIRGILFNRVSGAYYERLAGQVERDAGVPVLGCVPLMPDCALQSRYLGLVAPEEVADLRNVVETVADALEEHVDLDALVALAKTAPALAAPVPAPAPASARGAHPIIAVARDRAFSFYYADTLRAFERAGARLAFFSPLSDERLPEGASGLYLGGGYPERCAAQLSANTAMREAVARAVACGMPAIAECGGFLYLHRELADEQGVFYPMAGVVDARARRRGLSRRFGYCTLTAQTDGLAARRGETLRAHEFHYWESSDPGCAFHADKPHADASWECVHATPTLYAGFPHLHLGSEPRALERFVGACAAYAARGEAGAQAASGAAPAGTGGGRR